LAVHFKTKTILERNQDMDRGQQIIDPQDGVIQGELGLVDMRSNSGPAYLVQYTYTARNQLTTISGEDWSFNYSYDRSGNMTTRGALYNGINGPVSSSTNCPTQNYDALNRPTTWEQTSSALNVGSSSRTHYQYDTANREIANWREENGNHGESFTYEPTNQLASVGYNALVALEGVRRAPLGP